MIYHYTSIETLALILKSKKIRFNRLDQVDDILESEKFQGINFSKYLFVSCWTENKDENIALWKMYTDNMKGVRIGVSKSPFRKEQSKEEKFPMTGGMIEETEILPIPIQECYNEKFLIWTEFLKETAFLKKIEYLETNDLKQKYKDLSIENDQSTTIHNDSLAKFKHKRWSFQEESRFVMLILPSRKINNTLDRTNLLPAINKGETLPMSDYYIGIEDISFTNMEIILGPNCSDADKIIVDSLLKTYGVKSSSRSSKLKNKIRFARK